MVTKAEKRAKKVKKREQKINEQRAAAAKRRRNKKIINYTIISIIGVIALVGAVAAFQKLTGPGEYDDFAQCLTREGVSMYGVDWCPHCQEQKRLFGKSFEHVTYVNCEVNQAACQAENVESYPTWILEDGTRLNGVQELDALAQESGCTLA